MCGKYSFKFWTHIEKKAYIYLMCTPSMYELCRMSTADRRPNIQTNKIN